MIFEMAWPKGKPRGPQSDEQKTKIAVANIVSQKARWANPEKRARAVEGIKMSYEFGKLADRKVFWTEEMDAKLQEFYQEMKFFELRNDGARRLGVSERVMKARLKKLGLHKASIRTNYRIKWSLEMTINLRTLLDKEPPLSWEAIENQMALKRGAIQNQVRRLGWVKKPAWNWQSQRS